MLTFPTTPEAFIAYQEQLAGWEATGRDRELLSAWAEIFNLSYEDGLEKDYAALGEDLSKLDGLLKKREGRPAVHRYLQAAREWIVYAFQQGAQRGG